MKLANETLAGGTRTSDEKADLAINVMIGTVLSAAIIPTFVNWGITAAAMGTGVVAIGMAYGVELTKEEAWKLIRQFVSAAGFWFMGLGVGGRILSVILTCTGIGYAGAVALDAAISAALAYAIGMCAKAYFKGERDRERLGKMFRDRFSAAREHYSEAAGTASVK